MDTDVSAWTAPAIGVGVAIGYQKAPLGFSIAADLGTLNLRKPLFQHSAFNLQLDPIEYLLTHRSTVYTRMGWGAWISHPYPAFGRWAVVPGVGLDMAAGYDLVVREEQLAYRLGGGAGLLWNGALVRAGKHGCVFSIAERGTVGWRSESGVWLNVETEFMFMHTFGGAS